MQTITTIGLDIAKSVFQVHGVDADGHVVVRRQLKRRYVLAFFQKLPPCLVWHRGLRLGAPPRRDCHADHRRPARLVPTLHQPVPLRHRRNAACLICSVMRSSGGALFPFKILVTRTHAHACYCLREVIAPTSR